jgi:hypothetical protein
LKTLRFILKTKKRGIDEEIPLAHGAIGTSQGAISSPSSRPDTIVGTGCQNKDLKRE